MVNINTSVDDLRKKILHPEKRGLHVYTDAIAKDIQFYTRIGMTGIGTEDCDWDELNMYVYARMMWDPALSSNTLIADYCDRSYGKASAPMFRHWLVLHDARNLFRSQKPLAVGFLNQAKKAQLTAEEHRRIDTLEKIWATIQ
jgi:hypothetical protein